MTAAFQQRLSEVFDTLKPSEVWICGHRFEVEYFQAEGLNQENLGELDWNRSVIRLWDGLSDDMERNVLIHEIFHAVFEFAGLNDQSNEEEVVDRLATAQMAILRDPRNKLIINWLLN